MNRRKKYMFIMALMFCVFYGCRILAHEAFEVHVLDVDQGQAILIEADGQYALYDGGGRDTSSYVVSYLQQLGVDHLEYVIASHFDEDHIAGIIGSIYAIGCNNIIEPSYCSNTNICESYRNAVDASKAEVTVPSVGDRIYLGEAEITILAPENFEAEKENNRSIAALISYGNISVFIGGDAEAEEEADIVSNWSIQPVDVYIADHHGSGSSSSEELLQMLQPKSTVISCGADNSYGHPSEQTLTALGNIGSDLYRTDKQGTIVFFSDGNIGWFNISFCDDWTPGIAPNNDAELKQTGSKADAESTGMLYIGNKNTHKFHLLSCNSVKQMSEKNKVYFDEQETRDVIILQGYEPCHNCYP